MELRLAGMVSESVVDGPGLRTVLFTQGCPHHCTGCHNPDTWDPARGYAIDTDALVDCIGKPGLISGITVSGGEPFLQMEPLYNLVARLKSRGFHIMVYTGYTWEELLGLPGPWIRGTLAHIDLLVDGRFEASLRSPAFAFRGSANQKVICVPESLRRGIPVLDQRYHAIGAS